MILTLEVAGPPGESVGVPRKTFDRAGGTIGRHSSNHWVLAHPYVSSHHAAIRYSDGIFTIEDTKSANGVFINYGLGPDDVTASEDTVLQAATAAGRKPDDVEIWQIACLDCGADGEASRRKIGAILAFVSGYIMGGSDLARRGVPPEHRGPLGELRRRYSTRPGDADAALVAGLGLFDYLSRRLAICGTPEDCLAQVRAARAAGVRRLMFSVSLAVDPVRTVQLFGERVLPAVRAQG